MRYDRKTNGWRYTCRLRLSVRSRIFDTNRVPANIAPQSGIMSSLDHRLNSWSRYKSALFTLFILLLGACHILIYCSSLNLPPLNPDMTNFQGHSFKVSVTHPLPCIIYFPLHVIHLSCLGSEQPHGSHALSHVPKILSLY